MELDPDNLRFLLAHGADPNRVAGARQADGPASHAGTTPLAFQRALRERVKRPELLPRFDRAIAVLQAAGGR